MKAYLRKHAGTLLVIAGLAIAYVVLRTPDGASGSAAELAARLASGQPSVVEFYSNA